jgi:hypothetical protein
MNHLHSAIHFLGSFLVANESVRVTGFAHAIPLLLSKLAADELTQGSHELGEARSARAEFLEKTP